MFVWHICSVSLLWQQQKGGGSYLSYLYIACNVCMNYDKLSQDFFSHMFYGSYDMIFSHMFYGS